MSEGHFLFGVGAAKAGTTWLARALRGHAEVSLPPMKETHYFDSLEPGAAQAAVDMHLRGREAAKIALAEAETRQERRRARFRLSEVDRWLSLVARQEADDARYEWLMQRQMGPGKRVVADITPAYALLPSETLARMAALNGGRTKFLMILRDPLDRLWSNLRMTIARRTARGINPEVARGTLFGALRRGEGGSELDRADYAGTIARLEGAVAAEALSFVFFEDLFEPETHADLARFLGLSTPLEGPAEAVNEGRGESLLPEERAILLEALRPQYEFAQARFGGLPQRWFDNLAGDAPQEEVA